MATHSHIDPYITTLVDCKTRAFAARWGLTESAADDIRQEFWTDLLQRLPLHDPAKSNVRSFAASCVEHKASNLIRALLARYRKPEKPLIADEDDACEISAVAVISEKRSRRELDAADLHSDLVAAIADLPPRLRKRAQQLMSDSPRRLAHLGVATKHRIYREVNEIRQVFARHGLEAYC